MALNTKVLIGLVQKHPVLYDTSHPDYKNNRIKNKLWDTISAIHGVSDGDTLKKQWKNIRDSYSKHLRSCKTSTGQDTKFIDRYKTWPWAKLMAFLRPYLEFDETHSNIQRNAEEASTSQSTNTSTPINTAQFQPNALTQFQQNDTPQHVHSRRKRTSDQNQSQVAKVINYLSQSTEKDDDIDLLFKSYSKRLKKMTMRRQATVKFEIAKIMMKAEIEESEEMHSRLDTGQYLEDNTMMIVQPPASSPVSDTKESTYILSSLSPAFETVDALSPPSPTYIKPSYTEPLRTQPIYTEPTYTRPSYT